MREAIAFALYLPGLEMTLSFQLYNARDAERQMLFEHLQKLDANDLLVLDQGYPARWLIAHLIQHHIRFCMRVDQTSFAVVKNFLRSAADEQVVTIRQPDAIDCQEYHCQPITSPVRLVKVVRKRVAVPPMKKNSSTASCDFLIRRGDGRHIEMASAY